MAVSGWRCSVSGQMRTTLLWNRAGRGAQPVPFLDAARGFFRKLHRQRLLFLLLLPGFLCVLLFSYGPMAGLYMAFVEYKTTLGHFWPSLFQSTFVGFKWFRYFFAGYGFALVLRNTVVSSALTLVIGFIVPILIAIALNETRDTLFRRTVQTVSYMPYFISWVIAANMIVTLLSADGLVNEALRALGLIDKSILFIQDGRWFWAIIASSNTWKNMGYQSVIYLAAMAAINPELFEAARMDGAGRMKQIVHVTLPSITSTIVILLILSVGNLLNTGFDQYFLLGNLLNREYSDVVDTYAFRYGLQNGMFSYAAAVTLFKAVVAFLMVAGVNGIARRLELSHLF